MDRVLVYSHEDRFLFELAPDDVYELLQSEEINGEHKLTITTTTVLQREQRILTQDATGKWREWVVMTEDIEHASGSYMVGTYMAVWSLQHDLSTVPVSAIIGTITPVSAEQALATALSTTDRWNVGTVTVTTVGGASMYRTLAWSALATIVSVWGGEVDAEISVGQGGVLSRSVSLWSHQGSSEATRRFDYGADLTSIKRRVESEPFACRIIPLGKGEETGDGYGRKITIESVNGGKDYLQNNDVAFYVRRPTSDGYEYPTIYAENGDMETPAELKAWGLSVLEEMTEPKVTYEASVLQLSQAGMDPYGIALGDIVHCVDRKFAADGLRVSGRITRIEANLLDPSDTRVTIGHISKSLAATMRESVEKMDARIDSVASMAMGPTELTDDYMARVIQRLNEEANATGGYFYYVVGQGVRTYDRPVSDPAVGSEATQVVEIRGGNIRIANTRTSSGDWDWKTLLQSGHIASELVTVASLVAGTIGNPSGNYWNLDTGDFILANTAVLGGKTISEMYDALSESVTDLEVQFAQGDSDTEAPTEGWGPLPPTWEAGKYIWQRTKTTTDKSGTTYSRPVMISGRDGADGTSVTILGSYNTLAELQAAHPTGNDGDAYMVAGDLYIWNGAAWQNVGQIQGPQGPAGTSVTVSKVEYGTSNSASSMPSSWSTTAPTSIATGKWLWVKTSYSDGTLAYTKAYSGRNGEQGATGPAGRDGQDGQDGEDGVGIASIQEQYYLSTSNQTQVGGNWSNTQPAYISGNYYWTRSVISWDDGQVTYTDPVLANGINNANSVATAVKVDFDTLNTQAGVFNKLTNNGQLQGLFMQDNQLYLNATYLTAGIINANLIQTGKIQSIDGKVYFDLDNNELVCDKIVSTDDRLLSANITAQIGRITTVKAGNVRTLEGLIVEKGDDANGGIVLIPKTGDEMPVITTASNHLYMNVTTRQGGGNRWTGLAGLMVTEDGYTVLHSQLGGVNTYSESAAINMKSNNYRGKIILHPAQSGSGTTYETDGKIEMIGPVACYLSCSATNFITTSDRSLKEHVEYIGSEADGFIRKLQPALFRFKDGGSDIHAGFYAQDVDDADPYGAFVTETERDGESIKMLDYSGLIAPMVAYCQHLERRIEALERRLEEMGAK